MRFRDPGRKGRSPNEVAGSVPCGVVAVLNPLATLEYPVNPKDTDDGDSTFVSSSPSPSSSKSSPKVGSDSMNACSADGVFFAIDRNVFAAAADDDDDDDGADGVADGGTKGFKGALAR
jgi:hypothetical protein